jgi:hypothetical protein
MNVLRKCGIHSRILLSHKEEGNFVIWK